MKDVGFIVAAQNLHCGVNIRLGHPIECLSIIGGIELPEHELAVPGERTIATFAYGRNRALTRNETGATYAEATHKSKKAASRPPLE